MQQPPPPHYIAPYRNYMAPYPNAPPPAAPHDGKATTSLVFGIISLVGSMCYLGWIFGIVAIVMGITSRREIARSQGALGGGGTAVAGIVTGSIGLGISLLYIAFVVGMWIFAIKSVASTPLPTTPPVPYTAPTVTAPPTSTAPMSPLPLMAGVTDLHPSDGPLKSQLAAEYRTAAATHQKLMVVTMAKWSTECADIARAWNDTRVQAAAADAIVVRVDVDDFHADLVTTRMDRPEVPWFFLIGAAASPTDAMSADEWGANTAANIAPVIARFTRGTLKTRKTQPAGGTSL